MRKPFKGDFPITQIFNDKRFRASYTKFGLLGHNGVDYGCPTGTEILAPHSGKVIENLFDKYGYGNYVKIENDKMLSVLGHFKDLSKLKVGEAVKEGQVIGVSGSSGNSTGPHLHWGWVYKPRNRDNGFNGFMDQIPFMQLINDLESALSDLVLCKATISTNKTPLAEYSLSDLVKEVFGRLGLGVLKGGEN